MMKKLLLVYSLFFLASFVQADNCKKLLADALNKLNNAQDPQVGLGFFMEYSVQTLMDFNGAPKSTKDKFKVSIYKDKSRLTSTNIDLFKDAHYQVSIIRDQQKIMISVLGDHKVNDDKMKNTLMIQDSIIRKSEVISCSVQGQYKELTMRPEAMIKNKIGVDKMMFWIDPQKLTCKKIKVVYTKDKQVKFIEMEIQQANYAYKEEAFKGKAVDMVLDKTGRLLPGYKNYDLVDLRN